MNILLKKQLSYFFAFVITLASCNTNYVENKHFLFEAQLTGYSFPLYDHIFPTEMHIHNEYLILCESNLPHYQPDLFFHAYSLSDYKYIGSFGRKGRGPGEWIFPKILRSGNYTPYLYLMDVPSHRPAVSIHKMMIDSMVQVTEIGRYFVNKGDRSMSQPAIGNNSLLVFDELMPETAIRLHHLEEERPVITWNYGSNDGLTDKNRGTLCANDSRIIFLYTYRDRIDILDWNLHLKKRLNYQKRNPIIYKDPMDNVMYYGKSFIGESFFYTFYLGVSPKEFKANDHMGLVLEVYDLEGTPVCSYTFIGPTPTVFTVDERSFTLYGYNSELGGLEDFISVYQLTELMEYSQEKNQKGGASRINLFFK